MVGYLNISLYSFSSKPLKYYWVRKSQDHKTCRIWVTKVLRVATFGNEACKDGKQEREQKGAVAL